MKKVIVVGAGGHGKVVLSVLEKIKRSKIDDIEIFGFLDDGNKKNIHGYEVLGKVSCIKDVADKNTYFILAIGSNKIRKMIFEKYKEANWYTAIDPSAIVSSNVIVKEGSVVMPGAIINIDTVVGIHSIINTGSIVEHDCQIGNFVHLSPASVITGGCIVGDLVQVGAKSVLNPMVEICSNVLVGSGTVVNKNIDTSGVYVGVPSRKIKDME